MRLVHRRCQDLRSDLSEPGLTVSSEPAGIQIEMPLDVADMLLIDR